MLESQFKVLFARNKCVNYSNRNFHYFLCKNVLKKIIKEPFFEKGQNLHKFKKLNLFNLYNKMFISQRGLHTINQNVFAYGKHLKNINITFSKRASVSSTFSGSFDQMVPKSSEEAQELFSKAPQSHPDSKLLKVAVIGVPNSGKSTLINQLIGWKVCSVSQKVHTTQCSARAVFSQGLTQLVFVDTPGIVTPEEIKKHDLRTSLIIDPEKSLEQSDLIVVMHDVSNSYTHKALHPRVLRILFLYPTIPSVLALNKVDIIKKKNVLLEITNNLTDGVVEDTKIKVTSEAEITDEELADTLIHSEISKNTSKSSINMNAPPESRNQDNDAKTSLTDFEEESSRELSLDDVMSGKIKPTEKEVQELIKGRKGWPNFQEVFMMSALDGTGVEELQNYLLKSAKKAPWIFNDDVVTDQSPQEIVLMTVREKCLEYLKHNIPYELKFKLSYWDLSDSDVLSVLIGVYCKKKSHMKLMIGPGGKYAKRVASEAEQDLRNIFRTEVRLRVNFEYNPLIENSDL
ncbi:UNVERIFIED_CONTAM: hypothetical protein RMT77_019283 [Armadillidium vulgare]